MDDLGLWVKSAHIIAIISWMAGLLYLPRLMVYHARAKPGGELCETLKIMERRLLKAIMTPAMIAAWGFGLWLVFLTHIDGLWFWIKISAVLMMSAYHFAAAKWVKDFADDKNVRSEKFYRIANEVPAVLMVIIVLMVILKP